MGWTIAALITAAAVAQGSAHIQRYKADGSLPWDDLGESAKIFAGSIPVLGPVIDAAQGRKSWGDAGAQAGTTIVGLAAGPLLGAAAGAAGAAGSAAGAAGAAGSAAGAAGAAGSAAGAAGSAAGAAGAAGSAAGAAGSAAGAAGAAGSAAGAAGAAGGAAGAAGGAAGAAGAAGTAGAAAPAGAAGGAQSLVNQLGSAGTNAADAGAASIETYGNAGSAISRGAGKAAAGGGEAVRAQNLAEGLGPVQGPYAGNMAPQGGAMGPPTAGEDKIMSFLRGSALEDSGDPIGQARGLAREARPEFIGPRSELSEITYGMNNPPDVRTPLMRFQDAYARPFEALGEYTHPEFGKAVGRMTSNAISGAASNPDNPGKGAYQSAALGGLSSAGGLLGGGLADQAFGQGPLGVRLPKTDVGSAYVTGQRVGSLVAGNVGGIAQQEMNRPGPVQPKPFEPADLMQTHQMIYRPSNMAIEAYSPFRQRRLM